MSLWVACFVFSLVIIVYCCLSRCHCVFRVLCLCGFIDLMCFVFCCCCFGFVSIRIHCVAVCVVGLLFCVFLGLRWLCLFCCVFVDVGVGLSLLLCFVLCL